MTYQTKLDIEKQLAEAVQADLAPLSPAELFTSMFSAPTPRRDKYWESLSPEDRAEFLAMQEDELASCGTDMGSYVTY